MKRVLLALLACAGALVATSAVADPDDHGYRVPNGHLPPPGECRVWLPDRPAGQQPPPTSCRQAERKAYRYGGHVIYGGDEGRDDRYYDDDEFRRDRRYERRDGGDANLGGVLRDPDLRPWAFRNFDRNRDGRISATEFSDARARLAG